MILAIFSSITSGLVLKATKPASATAYPKICTNVTVLPRIKMEPTTRSRSFTTPLSVKMSDEAEPMRKTTAMLRQKATPALVMRMAGPSVLRACWKGAFPS